MKVVIMVSFDDEELKPLTQTRFKGMLDVFDKPILEYLINHLVSQKMTDITFVADVTDESIKNHFSDGESFGAVIKYSAKIPDCDELLYVSNPIITDINIENAIKLHHEHNRTASVVLCRKMNAKNYRIAELGDNDRVLSFDILENEVTSSNITTGIYILKKEFLDANPFFPDEFNPEVQAVYAINCEGYFCEIKSFEGYLSCTYDLLEGETGSLKTKNGVFLGENTFIEVGAKIKPPVYIGENTHIERDSEIMPYSVIGKNSRIEEASKIENSIVLNNVRIMKDCELSGCIIGGNSVIGQGAKLYSGGVVGEFTKIGKEAVIKQNVSVYNDKFIANNLVVSENVVTGACEPEIKFENGKITGDPTFDLSFYKAFKIGAVFGILNPNCPIGLFKDDSGSSEMIANSINAGLKSVGSLIYEFSNSLYNMCKTACSFYSLIGGIFVYNDNGKTTIEFFSKDGSNILEQVEQKIEKMLGNNEIPMVDPEKIPKTVQMVNYKNYYYSDIVKKLEPNRLSTNVVLEKTSRSVVDYMRKMAVLYNLTLIPVKKSGINSFIRAEISMSGKNLSLWDENGQKISDRQLEAITAIILNEDLGTDMYICLGNSSEALKMLLSDMKIEETGNHISELDRAMLKISSREQFFMKNDAVYLLYKILFYLKTTKNTLSELVFSLPRTYFAESTIVTLGGFESTIAKLISIENDTTSAKIKNKNK